MKKLFRLISAAIVSTAFLGTMSVSAATCNGTIEVTGPGSNNQISCSEVNNIVLTCTNNIIVATVNTQTGGSGNADVGNNTTGGAATSGSVVNENGQNVTVGASCDTLPSSTTETPGMGGGGDGGGAGSATPEELPNTASAQPALLALGAVAVSAILAGLSRITLTAYRRLSTH